VTAVLRPGALAYDFGYARSVEEEMDRAQLAELSAAHPRSVIRMRVMHGREISMGSVPADWDGSVVEWPS